MGKPKKRPYKATTDSRHKEPIADNVLDRDFTATAPNEKWVSDLTYIRTVEGWMYLCVVIDIFTRKVVGWDLSDSLATAVVSKAVKRALFEQGLHVAPNLLFHSDRGIQYASGEFRKIVTDYKLKQSMSRKANCWDNSVAESFFSSLKMEELYLREVPSKHELRAVIFDYIDCFYNTHRLHSTLGFLSPREVEQRYYKQAA